MSAYFPGLDPLDDFSPAMAATEHPVQMYYYAGGMEDMSEAAFWFYAGQLRFRIHRTAQAEQISESEEILFGLLHSVLGGVVNEYIGGDPQEWADCIRAVLAWDLATPNEWTCKEKFAEAHETERAGLAELLSYIEANHDTIRQERKGRGLENR
ncbi:hypothetical protein [Chitinivibrio alkaliphilus]|uniref:Uncharacterized protein n=1 Tax=Chitinivibrio alkaliphilus ACht1 TaxID=1313304 RepID=U7D9P1_9BACT|nr:hypothetical protein [Chitinivibrio alkaliphilus]ERP38742.1 hypothetical protein CALK_0761 [Chitinivibrio alkaliphilus ACht1]